MNGNYPGEGTSGSETRVWAHPEVRRSLAYGRLPERPWTRQQDEVAGCMGCAAAEGDGIDALINALSSKRDGAIANAATVLTNMAMQEPLRLNIQSHDVMHALLSPLHSANTVVQSKAALTVAATACDVEARTELRHSGGLEPLVELLRSKDDEVRRHASWAVMVCASDEPTAAELCRLGALDILEEINLSVSRKNKFSEAAHNKLLNHHLSLKYSQTGYLSSSNIITDGVYDYGRVSGSTNLYFSMCDQFFLHRDAITLQFYNCLT
ncbi:hypothetical protein J1605_005091 [Eschrichtius robustus]|uniref:Armadillo repeat-containing protein 3 n=1 Tax=Eschrichtius robustus TaxID=9764 RepID=A0AB34HD31_ESCRO|nr:hypothetical protein J1605_005091 [Eschrichtius robustus]